MTKYRVGDEVTLRGVITAIEQHHRTPLLVTMGCSELWFSESDIATHTPKQREFKPGDIVKIAHANSRSVFRIVCIDNGEAWLINDEDRRRWTATLGGLQHADEAE